MEGQGAATDASLAAVDRVASEMKISHGSCQHVSLQLYTSNADYIWQLLKIICVKVHTRKGSARHLLRFCGT